MAELKVSYKRNGKLTGSVTQPIHAEAYLRKIWDGDTIELYEEVVLLCLNTANEVFGWVKISSGGLDRSIIDSRVVFSIALQAGAAGIILAHNHPSGNLKPSEEDLRVTRKIAEGGNLLGIRLLDHVILGPDDFVSLHELGHIR
jgi:DNA repair protein RadC